MTETIETLVNESSFWYWDGVVDDETCDKIIALGEGQFSEASVIGQTLDICKTEDYRKTDVAWIDEPWVYDLFFSYMRTANESAGWNYDIRSCESVQLGRYTTGGFYDTHRDGLGSHKGRHNVPENELLHGFSRKISMSLLLTNEFEGGNLEFLSNTGQPPNFELNRGTVVAFPSFCDHHVTPVTRGVRNSAVTWFVGPPFK